jgi:peptidoglycan/LPS O-acetylase OafA/YrhL
MPDRVGTIFGLSWTLGIEEKFYLFWPFLCFLCVRSIRRRVQLGGVLYVILICLSFFTFKICRAYSGLLVGALLALLLSSEAGKRLTVFMARVPSAIVLFSIVTGFALVDLDLHFVFLFSWMIAFSVASLALHRTGLSIVLSNPVLVWIGKRSYAMYLIQGFGMQTLHRFITARTPLQEVALALGSFVLACIGASLLHVVLERPAIRLGKALIQRRKQKHRTLDLPDAGSPLMDRSPA